MKDNFSIGRRKLLLGLMALPAGNAMGSSLTTIVNSFPNNDLPSKLDLLILKSPYVESLKLMKNRVNSSEIKYRNQGYYQDLLQKLSSEDESVDLDSETLFLKIESYVRADYSSGVVSQEEGWIISKTEAALLERARSLINHLSA